MQRLNAIVIALNTQTKFSGEEALVSVFSSGKGALVGGSQAGTPPRREARRQSTSPPGLLDLRQRQDWINEALVSSTRESNEVTSVLRSLGHKRRASALLLDLG